MMNLILKVYQSLTSVSLLKALSLCLFIIPFLAVSAEVPDRISDIPHYPASLAIPGFEASNLAWNSTVMPPSDFNNPYTEDVSTSGVASFLMGACNTKEPFVNGTVFNNLQASRDFSGLCLPSVNSIGNVVDASLTNFATINMSGIGCSVALRVEDADNGDTYAAGSFAGFRVGTSGLLSASLAASVRIRTINNGAIVETYNASTSLVGINSSLINADGTATLGFVTTQPFDGVEIVYGSLVGVGNSFQVYHAVIESFCVGPELACNEQTQLNNPVYPTTIDGANTGITGLVCAGCSVNNAENVISASTSDFASIVLAVGAGVTGSIAVKDQLTTYPAGTFAGFNIENPSLINANLLSGLTVETFLNGVSQEVSTSGTLASLSSSLTGSGAQTVGFVTTLPFNEVKLRVSNLVGVLSTTNVYNVVLQKFCAGPALSCSTTTQLRAPDYPAIINGVNTGIDGLACVGCSVSNTQNLVDADPANFASIVLTVGVAASGSVSVKDQLTDYPAGTFAGFDIENTTLIGVDLLSNLRIRTYLNGVFQETSPGNLLSLQLFSASRRIVGFVSTLPFDEIELVSGGLASVDIGTTRVYNAVLRGGSAAGFTAPMITPTTVRNSCPETTFSLASLPNTGVQPAGASLIWSTSNPPASAGDVVADINTVSVGGKYYALYYDAIEDCYSPADSVVASIVSCVPVAGPCNIKEPFVNDVVFNNLSATSDVDGLICLSSAVNPENAVDADLSNFTQINLTGVGCTVSLKIADTDAGEIYPVGTFAGFKVSTANLISGSIASTITIRTYNNGSVAETYEAVTDLVGINASLINGDGTTTLGFVTTQPFDGVEIVYGSLVGVGNSFQVYHAVIESFCAGPDLACNEQTQLNNPDYPTTIDIENTGITGVCVGCSINNAENVISASTSDFASIVLVAGVAGTGSIAVKDQLTTYPAGTFAGFNIANPSLINVDLLSGLTVETFLNGVPQEESTSGTLASLSSSLTGSGAQTVGFVTTLPFNEVKLRVSNLVGVLSTTNVYNVVLQKFCPGPDLSCSTITQLKTPAYPAIVNGVNTGIDGLACVGCSVSNTQNLVDADPANFASIVLTAGVLASGSVSVKDQITDYPAGTFAGFDVENATLIGIDLLSNLRIRTYLNGVFQETSPGNLLSLQLLTASRQVIGFESTLPFDEIQLISGGLVSVDFGTTRVYNAVLRGASSAGFTAPMITPTTVTNTCPATTFSLASLPNTGVEPAGASLIWSTNNPPTSVGDRVADINAVSAGGKYYALYYDALNDCYSLADSVVATIVNCAPVAVDDDYTVAEDGSVVLLPLTGDTDVDGDPLMIASINGVTLTPGVVQTIPVTNGTVDIDAGGVITFTPDANFNGTVSFPYEVTDGTETVTGNQNITVTPVNDAPVAVMTITR